MQELARLCGLMCKITWTSNSDGSASLHQGVWHHTSLEYAIPCTLGVVVQVSAGWGTAGDPGRYGTAPLQGALEQFEPTATLSLSIQQHHGATHRSNSTPSPAMKP